MKCYLNITLLPNADIPLYFLWEKLYQQLHLALVECQSDDGKVNVGVAFPEYDQEKNHLGSKLRIFGTSKLALEELKITEWLSRLSDYIHITSIREVPEKIDSYAFFKRVQLRGSNERLARRKAKRENMSYDAALDYFKSRAQEVSKLPFIQMNSQSSSSRFPLLIEYVETKSLAQEGYSTYGLSSVSSVPIF